ncbi:hypothetical protein TrLO_g5882 [Triparma laevis f. longispina]|uniref:Steroid 5-alpha reductase C-terminal domain-containing protein n=1 Tax=Triparma laevis f. longispina TaxID=1714387 RepID=A0A9W7AAC9_9STRA|nr:hypothetical protein TrLO_g5882 [Triparma laevis f. longispina]
MPPRSRSRSKSTGRSATTTTKVKVVADDKPSQTKLGVIGVISNSIGLSILYSLGNALDILKFAKIALGVQWFVWLIHGLPYNSDKFYDISGSMTHFALVMSSLVLNVDKLHPRGLILSVCCVMWFTRLGGFLFARILRDGKDNRMDLYKQNPVRFLGVWTIQAVWVFLLNLPILVLNSVNQDAISLGVLDYVGFGFWVVGFIIEGLADAQKNAFRSKDANRDKFITTGLWAYSQHPNYLGEHMLWFGVCLSGSSVFVGNQFLCWLSLGFTALLLWKVSGIPLLEKHAEKKWGKDPAYQHYTKNTNKFFFGAVAGPYGKK